jgi:hypothetical protein
MMTAALRGFSGLILLLVALVLAAGAALLLWERFESLETIGDRLHAAAPWLSAMRVTVIVAVIAAWPLIVPWFTDDPAVSCAVQAARWRVAAWLAILEVTLGQGLVTAFVAGLGR